MSKLLSLKYSVMVLVHVVATTSWALSTDVYLELIISKNRGTYNSMALPMGYSDQELEAQAFVQKNIEVQKLIADLDLKSVAVWQGFVQSQWELFEQGEFSEFEFSDESSRKQYMDDPHKYLGLPAGSSLNPVEEVFAIYKDQVLIGYVVELFNQVRAQIIEDGSGTVLYLNPEFKLISLTEWDS